jgi:hypothetical protein
VVSPDEPSARVFRNGRCPSMQTPTIVGAVVNLVMDALSATCSRTSRATTRTHDRVSAITWFVWKTVGSHRTTGLLGGHGTTVLLPFSPSDGRSPPIYRQWSIRDRAFYETPRPNIIRQFVPPDACQRCSIFRERCDVVSRNARCVRCCHGRVRLWRLGEIVLLTVASDGCQLVGRSNSHHKFVEWSRTTV